jgi:mRNA-degrading endonuclease YafQ of YafQ-DinJ toxin-antitoxin module
MQIFQSSNFKRQVKKLYENEKHDLDEAVRHILKSPNIGEIKKGDLSGVMVYKFRMVNRLSLLAYEVSTTEKKIILLTLGSHENFYRDLKKNNK